MVSAPLKRRTFLSPVLGGSIRYAIPSAQAVALRQVGRPASIATPFKLLVVETVIAPSEPVPNLETVSKRPRVTPLESWKYTEPLPVFPSFAPLACKFVFPLRPLKAPFADTLPPLDTVNWATPEVDAAKRSPGPELSAMRV